MVLSVIGALIVLLGLFLCLDSRRLVKKYFNFGEENNAVLGMKILGFAIVIVGGIVLFAIN